MSRDRERAAREATTATAAGGGSVDEHAAAGPPAPGTWLGRYRLDRVLGHGGMGVVFAAHDAELDRTVAVKLLRGDDELARARLVREARAMARVRHPNLITVHEVDTAGDRDFVAMELIDGASLDAWLETARTPDQILDVFAQAARGLIAAHAQGLVHRDFKPSNVLVGSDGRVVVTDFGLARATAADADAAAAGPSSSAASADRPASWSPALTATGAAVGTPAYMAPEQWEGAPPDPRGDQFAFCVSLWEALAGERPFGGETEDALRAAAAGGPPQRGDRIPWWLLPVLRRGLAARPAARWPSMAALATAIERGRGRRRRRRRVALAGAIGAALASATALYLATRARSGPAVGSAPGGDGVCQPVDTAAAELWSTARRARLDAHLAGMPEVAARLDALFRDLTARWREAYQRACLDRVDRQRLARIACLESRRDRLLSYLDALDQIPPAVLSVVPFGDVIDGIEPCAAPTPVMAPVASSAEVRRRQRQLETETIVLRFGPRRSDDAAWASLLARVDALGHPPLAAELRLFHASMLHRREDFAAARVAYDEAAVLAETAGAAEVRALALGGLVELTVRSGASPAVIDDALRRARAAAAAVGAPPRIVAPLDMAAGTQRAAAGDIDGAIATWEAVHRMLAGTGDHRRAAVVVELIADALITRGGAGDLARARAVITAEIERQRGLLGRHAIHLGELERQLAALPVEPGAAPAAAAGGREGQRATYQTP